MPENNIVDNWTRNEWESVQRRAVNPYRSVEARAVNRLTRVVTKGSDVSLGKNKIEFIDYKTIRIKANKYVKDDVYIEFLEDISLDMTDDTNYYSKTYKGMNSIGTYWIGMIYTFINSIPYPYASFKIIKREEDISDEVYIIGRFEVIADPSVTGGYAVDRNSIETDSDTVLYVDALRTDLLQALAARTAVNYKNEELIFTHEDPDTKTDFAELDVQVQSAQHYVNRLRDKVLSMQRDVRSISYDDLYGPGMPLEDLADYEPKYDPFPVIPEPEPEETEPETETDPFEINSVYLSSYILNISFKEAINIHNTEMEHGIAFVTSMENHTVIGYPNSYTMENGDLRMSADFSDTNKYIMISAGLLETFDDKVVQANDIVFSLNEYINGNNERTDDDSWPE